MVKIYSDSQPTGLNGNLVEKNLSNRFAQQDYDQNQQEEFILYIIRRIGTAGWHWTLDLQYTTGQNYFDRVFTALLRHANI